MGMNPFTGAEALKKVGFTRSSGRLLVKKKRPERPPLEVQSSYFLLVLGLAGVAAFAGADVAGRQKSGAAATVSSGGLLMFGTKRLITVSVFSTTSPVTFKKF